MKVIGWAIALAVGAILTWNAAFMAISPKAWFRLPSWLRANGALTRERYSSGWGAVEVRLAGVATLAVIGWVLYDFLIKH